MGTHIVMTVQIRLQLNVIKYSRFRAVRFYHYGFSKDESLSNIFNLFLRRHIQSVSKRFFAGDEIHSQS